MQQELRGPLLVLLMVVPALAFAAWHTHSSVASSQDYERLLRTANTERDRVLRFQIDEETGVRGYVETKDARYLDPYKKGRQLLRPALTSLGQALDELKLGMPHYVEEQSRRNATWIATIARPLITHSNQDPVTRKLEHRDNEIVDDYRNADQVLAKRLNTAEDAAEADERVALNDNLAFVIGSTLLLAGSIAAFGFLQARTAREASQSFLLFKRQERIADVLQAAYLDRTLPMLPSICLHACYVPAARGAHVGGDWYDAFEVPNGRILFSIGDVTGHGLEAAVIMSRARQAILALSLGVEDPAAVLALANEALMLQDSPMVTAICGYIDVASLEVTYAAAGHPAPAFALPGERAHFLPQGGVPLGVVRNATFETHVAHAFDGALLVLYTDGVIEHQRDIIDGERRLIQAAMEVAQEDNPARAIERIMLGESTPIDDVTILTISFKLGEHGANILRTRSAEFERDRLAGPIVDGPEDSAPRAGAPDA